MEPLFQPLNDAVMGIVSHIGIRYDVLDNAPDTLEGIASYYRKTGRLAISVHANDRTIYGDPAVNVAARAWHDWHHIQLKAPFDLIGETLVYHAQAADLGAWPDFVRARDILYADVVGQGLYSVVHGRFPYAQREFVCAFLSNAQLAIEGDF